MIFGHCGGLDTSLFGVGFWARQTPKKLPHNLQPNGGVPNSTKMRHVLCAPQMEGEMDPEKTPFEDGW